MWIAFDPTTSNSFSIIRRFIIPLLVLTTGLTTAIYSQPIKTAPKPAGLGLQDGDRFIFIGGSITHQCLYTQCVEDFFYTRYPKMRLCFRDTGVSGYRAVDTLNRYDDDIAASPRGDGPARH